MKLTLRSFIEQLIDLEEELGNDRVLIEAIVQPNYPMIAPMRGLAWTQNADGSVSVYLQLDGNSDYAPREFDDERRLELGDGRPV